MNKQDKTLEHLTHLHFQRTEEYDCPYLPGRRSASEITLPVLEVDAIDYNLLVQHGFRRSNLIVYRPNCSACRACIPIRVPVNEFLPDRTQRRLFKKHQGIKVRQMSLVFDETHYQLYQRYQKARHPNGGMECESREEYEKVMLHSNVESCLFEFSENDQVKMVCLTDILEDGLSSVYTFFEPDEPAKSWGTYGILRQIELSRNDWLPWLYLGYWIPQCQKMAYKANFRPAEILVDGQWRELEEPRGSQIK